MAQVNQDLHNLQYNDLKGRRLWHDGQSSYNPDYVMELIRTVPIKYVDRITTEISQFNLTVPTAQRIKIKEKCESISSNLHEDIEAITQEDLLDLISYNHDTILHNLNCSEEERSSRELRLASELTTFLSNTTYTNILKIITYVVTRLTITDTVWGVGRGSSVSSYLLYVIGSHDVDSFKYELDFKDFIEE